MGVSEDYTIHHTIAKDKLQKLAKRHVIAQGDDTQKFDDVMKQIRDRYGLESYELDEALENMPFNLAVGPLNNNRYPKDPGDKFDPRFKFQKMTKALEKVETLIRKDTPSWGKATWDSIAKFLLQALKLAKKAERKSQKKIIVQDIQRVDNVQDCNVVGQIKGQGKMFAWVGAWKEKKDAETNAKWIRVGQGPYLKMLEKKEKRTPKKKKKKKKKKKSTKTKNKKSRKKKKKKKIPRV